jgi:2,3-bisphosphoglycerate-dependent phosphoglycerate mutase
MDATRILAIRHGETAWNVDTRIQGQLDIPLNPQGQWQARQLGLALRTQDLSALYTSDLSRARLTAQAIAQARTDTTQPALPLIPHTGLRERHFGHFQGQTFQDIEARWPEEARRWRQRDPVWSPDGGESLQQLQARVLATLNTLAAQHLGEQIVLVAHGGVIDVLYRAATGQPLNSPRTWVLRNTAINRLLWTPDSLTLVGWSDTRHLDEDPSPTGAATPAPASDDRST